MLFGAAELAAQPPATPQTPTTQPATTHAAPLPHKKPVKAHRKAAAGHIEAAAAHDAAKPAAPAPQKPPMPDWPANKKPSAAKITWDSRGLLIDASNSSLDQTLQEAGAQIGARVDGLNDDSARDQRIFGVYGPGPARDVLAKLLYSTGYNVVMIGDQGGGTPRQILLSVVGAPGASSPAHAQKAPAAAAPPLNPQSDADSDTADDQPASDQDSDPNASTPAARAPFNPQRAPQQLPPGQQQPN